MKLTRAAGACAALVSAGPPEGLPALVVPDTQAALGRLGRAAASQEAPGALLGPQPGARPGGLGALGVATADVRRRGGALARKPAAARRPSDATAGRGRPGARRDSMAVRIQCFIPPIPLAVRAAKRCRPGA